jgi:hypothetical protein
MARTAITPQIIVRDQNAAVTFVAADAVNGMTFVNDGNTELLVNNGGGSPCTVTVHSVADPFGRTGDLTPAVAAAALEAFPVLDPVLFNQPGSSQVNVDFSEGTSVTVAVIKRG